MSLRKLHFYQNLDKKCDNNEGWGGEGGGANQGTINLRHMTEGHTKHFFVNKFNRFLRQDTFGRLGHYSNPE